MLDKFFNNVIYSDKFDEFSFFGLLEEHCIWNDKEYFKFEKIMLKIMQKYHEKELPNDISKAVTFLSLVVLNWGYDEIKIDENNLYFYQSRHKTYNPSINDRFYRLQMLLLSFANDDFSFFKREYYYRPKTKYRINLEKYF